jgi:hypothetical protein
MSNDSAVREKLRAILADKLAQVNLSLFTANGTQSFNFSAAADNLTEIFLRFWQQNQRMPALLFNDGLPPSWKPALEAHGLAGLNGLMSPVVWMARESVGFGEANYGMVDLVPQSIYAFNCKLNPNPGVTTSYVTTDLYGENQINVTIPVDGPQNSRFVILDAQGLPHYTDIPRASFNAGAFQTWGLMLVAVEHPEFIYATDEGCMLTMEGVAMIERSASYWIARAISSPDLWPYADQMMRDHLGNGPVMLGIPSTLTDMLIKMEKQNAIMSNPIVMIAQWVLTFVGFYFGAAAASGLVGGAFTITNLTGTLSLASKFGLDTGQLSTALKVAGTLTGDAPLWQSPGNSTGAPIMSAGEDWGPDPTLINFDSDADWSIYIDGDLAERSLPEIDNAQFYSMLDVDPVTLEYSGEWTNAIDGFSEARGDWGPPPEAYNDAQILTEQNDMLSYYMNGGVSAVQYAAAAGASPAASAAAQVAMKAVGGSSTSTGATPQQIAAAAQVAQQKAQSSAGKEDATIWTTAAQLLSLYGKYQGNNTTVPMPTTVRAPSSVTGSLVRQPDGSISMQRSDGTVTTIRPNGSTATTNTMQQLSSFVSSYKVPLMIGAGVIGLFAAISLARSR